MKFPSLAKWPQPKGLHWFGSCDHSVVWVSNSGAILNSVDRSWSGGRNLNQMWAAAAKHSLCAPRTPRGGSDTA